MENHWEDSRQGKNHGRTYRVVACTSDIFFLISVAILAHGHMSLQEHLRDIIFFYVQKREIDLPLTTWLHIVIFFDQHFPHFRNLLRSLKLFQDYCRVKCVKENTLTLT